MNTEETIKTEAILKKIKSGKALTRKEDIFYITVVLGYTEQEAETILAIAENKDPLVLID